MANEQRVEHGVNVIGGFGVAEALTADARAIHGKEQRFAQTLGLDEARIARK